MQTTGILLVAHGTPATIEDIPAFLANIRRGRPTPQAIVEEVQRRYLAIGGRSPVLDTSREQARLVSQRMGIQAFVATRMWHPYIVDGLREIAATNLRRLIVVTMAPHSAHVYEPVVRQAADVLRQEGRALPELVFAPCWGDEPTLHRAWAELAREVIASMEPRDAARSVLVTTAHSLPMRAIEAGDPYARLVHETAEAVVASLGQDGLPHMHAFQSQGMTTDPWLGPDLPSVFQRAKNTGATTVVLLPVGFVADHVETLYDLDIEAKAIATELGLGVVRVPCLNTVDGLIEAVANVVGRALQTGGAI